jgi:hypothetical protein
MIHGNSSDPVFLKKISLKVWTLRSEIQAYIQEKAREGKTEELDAFLAQLQETFQSKGVVEAPVEEEPQGSLGSEGADDAYDAMAAAMSEGGDEEEGEGEAEEADAEEGAGGEDDADAMAAQMLAENGIGEEETAPPEKYNFDSYKVSIENSRLVRSSAFLAEITMDRIYFFSTEPFMEGQSIVIDFLIPKRFILNGNVFYCRTYNLQRRIISDKKPSYRVAVDFTFLRSGERSLLRQFLQSVEPDIPVVAPTPSGGDDDDFNDDDFDELDDLGL